MRGCAAWPASLVVALLLSWIAPGQCAAQSPGSPVATNSATGDLARAAQPSRSTRPLESVSAVGTRSANSLPPSSVSPAIERFMKQSGQGLAPATTIATVGSMPGQNASPLPPPANRTTTPTAIDRVTRPISRQVPSPLTPPIPPTTPGSGSRLLTMGPSPLSMALNLKPAPHESTDLSFPINLATALRLSDARPLIVAAAQASVWVAEAQAHTREGAVGSLGHNGRGLYPPRWRRPGHQQGCHDRCERELFLRRSWLVAVR